MVVTGAATSLNKRQSSEAHTSSKPRQRIKAWLRSWCQVLIGELLHILEHRGYSHPR